MWPNTRLLIHEQSNIGPYCMAQMFLTTKKATVVVIGVLRVNP